MMIQLKSYHRAWLSIHPERTAHWLQERLTDGFDIHHVDGNHFNDSPDNLALIEGNDHLRLHGLPMKRNLFSARRRSVETIGKDCYEARRAGMPWRDVDTLIFNIKAGPCGSTKSAGHARHYALSYKREWPIICLTPAGEPIATGRWADLHRRIKA